MLFVTTLDFLTVPLATPLGLTLATPQETKEITAVIEPIKH